DGDNGDGNDDADDNDGDGDGDDNQNGNDGDDNGAGDGDNADDSNGGIADADNDDAGARAPDNQQNNTPNTDRGNTEVDPTLDTTRTTETAINPVNDVRDVEEFEETGTGTIVRAPDPEPTTDPSPTPSLDPIPAFIQPNTDFLTLVANSGFNSNFTLSELQGVTGRFSEVLAFEGLADIGGGISATAVGDNGATTSITSLTMTFDLNFSASLAQVTNGFLGIKLDDAPQAIAFNIYFDGSIINSQSNFTIGANSNRTQGSQTTSIDLQTSFLNSILVDDSVKQALFSDFFFEDTQGLGVEGQVLIGFATPVLSPADNLRISDRVGFVLSRNAAPGAIFPGNVTELIPGQEVILAGNDLSSPFTLNTEPPYIFRGAGSFLDFTDGTITQGGERPYDFEIGIWGSSSNPVSLYTDFVDNNIFELIESSLIVVSVDPAPLAALTGRVVYLSNFDRVLGGSSLGGGISQFFTAFNVDFSAALITDGVMEFCIGGDASCSGDNAQFWDFDYSGAVVNGFVVASPVENKGYINDQLASIFGFIEGVFTGDNAEAFVGGFNLFYDDDLDIYRNSANGAALGIPDTTVDGVFLIEKDLRLSSADFDSYLDSDSFLIQEGYARILLGFSRPTLDEDILFVDGRSRPRLVLTDPANEVSISKRNDNLPDVISTIFGLDWERWEGPLTVSTDNLNLSAIQDGANDPIHDVALFSTFRTSEMHDITGHYNRVLGFIGEDESGTAISDVEMSFDINFSTSFNNIQNGILKVFVDGADEEWLAFFEGDLLNNVVEFEFFDINPNAIEETEVVGLDISSSSMSGIYIEGSFDSSIDFGDSNMQGVIIDDGRNTPALLSSFYFREDTEGPGRTLTGQTLVAREDDRLEMFFETDEEVQYRSIINIPYLSNNDIITETFDDGPIGLNQKAYGVSSDDLRSNNSDVFFLGVEAQSYFDDYGNDKDYFYACECDELDYFSVDFLQTVDEHVDFTHFDENSFMLSESEFDLDMGSWAGTVGLFELGIFEDYDYYEYYDEYELNSCGTSNFNCFGLEQEGFENPAFWLNYTSFYFNPYYLTGRFSTVLEAFGEFRLTDSSGGIVRVPIDRFILDVEIEFYESSSHQIEMGQLLAISSSSPSLDAPLEWLVDFYYDDFDELRDGVVDASFNITDGDDGPINSNLILDLAGTEDFPILVGSFQSSQGLDEGGNIEVAGIFAAQQTRVALLVENYQNLSDPGSVLFGSASRPLEDSFEIEESSSTVSPRIGINFNTNGEQDIANIDLTHPFDLVVTGDSTVNEIDASFGSDPISTDWYPDTDFGYWNSENMTIIHNQSNNSIASGDSLLWATVFPATATELADHGGTVTINHYNGAGSGTAADGIAGGTAELINQFYMSFSVDFGTGDISNGELKAALGSNTLSTPDWHLNFDGAVSGAFAEMNNFSGSINGSDILGEVKSVFTSPYNAISGFSLHTELGDYLTGIGFNGD
ncbi:MAG: hypothetical protein COA71_14625, partial [SAR86 cluster bacterium]